MTPVAPLALNPCRATHALLPPVFRAARIALALNVGHSSKRKAEGQHVPSWCAGLDRARRTVHSLHHLKCSPEERREREDSQRRRAHTQSGTIVGWEFDPSSPYSSQAPHASSRLALAVAFRSCSVATVVGMYARSQKDVMPRECLAGEKACSTIWPREERRRPCARASHRA